MLRDRWFLGRKTRTFTLQWHLTNDCPLHCAHCYDRSDRGRLSDVEARRVLAELYKFCRRERVAPRVCLTGGDPLLYPGFWDLYRELARNRTHISILGNPVPAAIIDRLVEIQRPAYYQISLEGLAEHNDSIRGPGHFQRSLRFVLDARRAGVETHVMLTLTRTNLDQVIPLGGQLRGLTHRFTFNRLAQVGEGAKLESPTQTEYIALMKAWTAAARDNPVFGFKDNLFNILRERNDEPLIPGCTGFGCGAAFNFMALLPDGQLHACRKFPSPLGQIRTTGMREIYHSENARRFRRGPEPCQGCNLRNSCGGCPAVTYGYGKDPLKDVDPHCFKGTCPSAAEA